MKSWSFRRIRKIVEGLGSTKAFLWLAVSKYQRSLNGNIYNFSVHKSVDTRANFFSGGTIGLENSLRGGAALPFVGCLGASLVPTHWLRCHRISSYDIQKRFHIMPNDKIIPLPH